MDDIQENTKPISDDQDLAKALAGINTDDADEEMDFTGAPPVIEDINAQLSASMESAGEVIEVKQPEPTAVEITTEEAEVVPETEPVLEPVVEPDVHIETTPTPEVIMPDLSNLSAPSDDRGSSPDAAPNDEHVTDPTLEPIKNQVLNELRPIVGKLELPADEKFETYLLLIRSSDDKTLVEPAYQTALQIEDETKRAQALLDIIKEIEFLSN